MLAATIISIVLVFVFFIISTVTYEDKWLAR